MGTNTNKVLFKNTKVLSFEVKYFAIEWANVMLAWHFRYAAVKWPLCHIFFSSPPPPTSNLKGHFWVCLNNYFLWSTICVSFTFNELSMAHEGCLQFPSMLIAVYIKSRVNAINPSLWHQTEALASFHFIRTLCHAKVCLVCRKWTK